MIYTITNDYLSVSIETFGAQLKSIKKRNYECEYLYQGSNIYWANRAINLFPICGRLKDNKYTYNNIEYELGCHGFARHQEFSLDSISESSVTFKLSDNDETLNKYPFKFDLRITYELNGNIINIKNTVLNKDNKELLFTTGGHPGFNCPLDKSLDFSDYIISFNNVSDLEEMGLTPKGLRTGLYNKVHFENGLINLDHHMFDNGSPFYKNSFNEIRLYSLKDKKAVTVRCPKANFFGLWHTDKSDAPFICIEPWLGCPSLDNASSSLEEKDYMIKLKNNESYEFKYEIEIE